MRSDLDNGGPPSSVARASSTGDSEKAPDPASPSCSSNSDSCIKENINFNKCETPKLSLEPLQMKRKKKAGGYNLRKSLAWDRAFFTEEGILDPLELSTISDVSCREGSSFINKDTGCHQDEDLGKNGKKDWSSTKLHSSSSKLMRSTSQTSQRFPTHGIKPGSRNSDCPRPLPSPSLKRPANLNVSKAAGKEAKLPKFPGLKPSLSPTSAMTRSTTLRANRVKHNQITQPDFSTQRHADLKISSKSLKKAQNISNSNSLQSAHQDGNSACRRHSSINNGPVMVEKANNSGSKIISKNATPIRPENSSEGHGSTTSLTSFSMNAQFCSKTVDPLQNQTSKPSGLRMPSPSLSFFSQPKTFVFRDLPMRVTETDVFGSQKLGNNMRRIPDTFSRIIESTSSTGNAVNSRSECMMPSHVCAIELTKPNSEEKPTYKIQDLPRKDIVERVSHEEAVLQNIGNEVPPQGGFHQQAMHIICKKAIDVNQVNSECMMPSHVSAIELTKPNSEEKPTYKIQDLPRKDIVERVSYEEAVLQNIGIEVPPQGGSAMHIICKKAIDVNQVNSESCGSGHRNAESGSEQNYAIQDSESIGATDEPLKGKDACSSLDLNPGHTQCTDAHDDGPPNTLTVQSDCGKTCKPDCHEDSLEYSLGDTDRRDDKDANVTKIKERGSETGSMAKQNISYCGGSIKALGQRQSKTESLYLVSKQLCADLLKESASIEVLTDNLNAGEAHMQNSEFDLTTRGCKNDINLESEVGEDIKQAQKDSENTCLQVEKESENIVKLDTGDRLSPEKKILLQSSHQEEHFEKLILVPGINIGDKVIDTKMQISLSPGCRHEINLGREKTIAPPLTSMKLDFADNSLSSENCNSSTGNLSNFLHKDTQRMETNNCSPLPESRIFLGKESACIQNDSANNQLFSSMLLKGIDSDVDNLSLWDRRTKLVQSPESNMLNDVCPKQPECTVSASDEFVAENLVHSNDRMQPHTEKATDMYSEDNALSSMEDSVTGQNKMCLSNLIGSSLCAKESPLEYKSSNDVYETVGHTVAATTFPSRVEPFSDTIEGDVSENTNCSFSDLHPKLDHDMVETAEGPKSNHQSGLNEKSRLLVLPQNAIPFSDEWLAAIEAAGEDILTRKSGAVQNSPPDKSLPEPSPWSPVKRKNNQIGPFDCTKFTAPSDSNCL